MKTPGERRLSWLGHAGLTCGSLGRGMEKPVGCAQGKTSRAGRANAGRCARKTSWPTGRTKRVGGPGWAEFKGEAGFWPMAGW
jgi:hypothetical protein